MLCVYTHTNLKTDQLYEVTICTSWQGDNQRWKLILNTSSINFLYLTPKPYAMKNFENVGLNVCKVKFISDQMTMTYSPKTMVNIVFFWRFYSVFFKRHWSARANKLIFYTGAIDIIYSYNIALTYSQILPNIISTLPKQL